MHVQITDAKSLLKMYATTYVILCIVLSHYSYNCEELANYTLYTEAEELSDCYWREFHGIIPGDAIDGGFDRAGRPTYIGQVYHTLYELLPANIHRGSAVAISSASGSTFTSDKYVKILCSRNLHRYKWIPTKNDETHLWTNCPLVIGGTQHGFYLNIGRVYFEQETIIGKVFEHHTSHRGLTIPAGRGERLYQSYDILTYNCKQYIYNNTAYSIE